MNVGLSLAIPCRADEPGLGATLTSLFAACRHPSVPEGLVKELLICFNGLSRGLPCASVLAARQFCADFNIPMREIWLTDSVTPWQTKLTTAPDFVRATKDTQPETQPSIGRGSASPLPVCTMLLTERRGKPLAWNALVRHAAGAYILFCDADVRVDAEAVWVLSERMQQTPHLALIAAREVPVIEGIPTLWTRMGALPYRFNFGNVGGRLFLFRAGALCNDMPEDLLLEDAWLTVAVGKHRVAKEWRARVYFLLPATGRDYFAERVRTEGGKLQIRQAHGQLLAAGPIAVYPWAQFFSSLAVREYPLVFLALVVRGVARVWARLALVNKEFYALYRPFRTTKDWSRA